MAMPKSYLDGADFRGEFVPQEDLPHLEYLRQWIKAQAGLNFSEKKQVSLYRRLCTLCWKLGIPNLGEMARQLREQDSSQLAADIVCTVSTNHTFFFRETGVLEHLTQLILPQLPPEEPWRIWSAATASGDEAYTVAMLLIGALGFERARQKVAILGTDISRPMIETAEHGVYVDRNLEMMPEPLRRRFFQPVGLAQWRVIPELKEMCTFRSMNLQSEPWPFSKLFHVILCRNVFYYFDLAHQERLAQRLYDAAEPGGWLLTSVTETLYNLPIRWRKVAPGLFRKL